MIRKMISKAENSCRVRDPDLSFLHPLGIRICRLLKAILIGLGLGLVGASRLLRYRGYLDLSGCLCTPVIPLQSSELKHTNATAQTVKAGREIAKNYLEPRDYH